MKSIKTGFMLIMVMLLASSCLAVEGSDNPTDNTAVPSATQVNSTISPSPEPTQMIVSVTATPIVETAIPTLEPTATPTQEAAAVPTPKQFSASEPSIDAKVAFLPQELSSTLYQISIGMDTAEVDVILGPPVTMETEEYMYGGEVVYYHYNDCQIEFKPRFVERKGSDGAYALELTEYHNMTKIVVTGPGYVGPRGIKIGDTVEEVFEKFDYPVGLIDGTSKVIYDEDDILIDITIEDGQATNIGMLFENGGADFNIAFSNGKVESMEMGYYLE